MKWDFFQSLMGDEVFCLKGPDAIDEDERPRRMDCVYFLVNRGTIVYVGVTCSIGTRPFQHRDKKHQEIHFIMLGKAAANVESALISIMRPKYNIAGSEKLGACGALVMAQEFGVECLNALTGKPKQTVRLLSVFEHNPEAENLILEASQIWDAKAR